MSEILKLKTFTREIGNVVAKITTDEEGFILAFSYYLHGAPIKNSIGLPKWFKSGAIPDSEFIERGYTLNTIPQPLNKQNHG